MGADLPADSRDTVPHAGFSCMLALMTLSSPWMPGSVGSERLHPQCPPHGLDPLCQEGLGRQCRWWE